MAKPLTAITVARLRAGTERREISDGGCRGLFLIIQPSGHKSWALRYRSRNRSVKFTLGSVLSPGAESATAPEVDTPLSLAAARELATRTLREVQTGHDPAVAKRKRREEQHAAGSDTLRAVSEEFLRRHPQLRTLNQRRADLELFYPSLGQLPIDQVRRGQIFRELDRISDERGPVRADRALSAMKTLLNWHSQRSDYLPVLGRGGRRTSTQERARSRVLDDGELRRVWVTAESFGLFGDLVRFLLLTCARRTEAAALKFGELSADGKVWTLPAARNKSKRDVVFPLSEAAQRILAARPKLAGGDHVFSATGRHAFGNFGKAKRAFDKACGAENWRLHDLRRSSRTLLSRCNVRPDIAERCLGHSVGGGVQATYDRHSYEVEVRAAFEALAALIERLVRPPPDVVVPIARAKARRK